MSDYTPNEATVIAAYVEWAVVSDREVDTSEAAREFDRFIAKTEADALRKATMSIRVDVATALYLHDRANQIEGKP